MRFTRGLLSSEYRLTLLAPCRASVPDRMRDVRCDPYYGRLMGSMQRLRGRVYLADGAIKSHQLSPEGRYITEADDRSWHVLMLNRNDEVCGCASYIPYPRGVTFSSLGVSRSALAKTEEWKLLLRESVEEEIGAAHRSGLAYVEVGGWALAQDRRATSDALRIALASYALADLLGGCFGLSTATYRHHSCGILQRIGGRPLECEGSAIPPYYDPRYACLMQVLRFDSRMPNPLYAGMIADLAEHLLTAAVHVAPANSMYALTTRLLAESSGVPPRDHSLSSELPNGQALPVDRSRDWEHQWM